jgi:hypothetical protein
MANFMEGRENPQRGKEKKKKEEEKKRIPAAFRASAFEKF